VVVRIKTRTANESKETCHSNKISLVKGKTKKKFEMKEVRIKE
jgi:hypothetical protein